MALFDYGNDCGSDPQLIPCQDIKSCVVEMTTLFKTMMTIAFSDDRILNEEVVMAQIASQNNEASYDRYRIIADDELNDNRFMIFSQMIACIQSKK